MTTHPDALFEVPKDAVHLSFRPPTPNIGLGYWFATQEKHATPMSVAEAERLIKKHIGPRGSMVYLDSIHPSVKDPKCIVEINDDHEIYHLPTMYLVCPR